MPNVNRTVCLGCAPGRVSQSGLTCSTCPGLRVPNDEGTACMQCGDKEFYKNVSGKVQCAACDGEREVNLARDGCQCAKGSYDATQAAGPSPSPHSCCPRLHSTTSRRHVV